MKFQTVAPAFCAAALLSGSAVAQDAASPMVNVDRPTFTVWMTAPLEGNADD